MGRFVIKRAGSGMMFNLFANNGLIICTSQTYTTKAACKAGIESVRKNANVKVEDQTLRDHEEMTNPKYEIYVDKGGEYRFRLKAPNGETIVASQGYTTKSACKNGIESIGKNAPDSEVEDSTVVRKEAAETKKPAKTAPKTVSKKTAAKKPPAKKPAKAAPRTVPRKTAAKTKAKK